jgi:hypothetical protein
MQCKLGKRRLDKGEAKEGSRLVAVEVVAPLAYEFLYVFINLEKLQWLGVVYSLNMKRCKKTTAIGQ